MPGVPHDYVEVSARAGLEIVPRDYGKGFEAAVRELSHEQVLLGLPWRYNAAPNALDRGARKECDLQRGAVLKLPFDRQEERLRKLPQEPQAGVP